MHGRLGKDYARLMLKQSVYDVIHEQFASRKLEREFYQEGYPALVEHWYDDLSLVGFYPSKPGMVKYVFSPTNGLPTERIFVQIGDNYVNKLSDCPRLRLDISDILFETIGRKGDPETEPFVFADGDRIVNLFALKNTG